MKQDSLIALSIGIIIGLLLAIPLYAQGFVSWPKVQVVPVVFVRPTIGGFAPMEGSSIGNIWSKNDVVPMCLVKPAFLGFVPKQGSTLANSWTKDEVKPFILVKPSPFGSFVPST